MATRKQLQEKRNKAVVAQRQAKNRAVALSAKNDDSGWAAVRKAAATTKALGDKMRKAVKAKDTSKADYAITTKNVDEYVKGDGTLKQKTSVAPTGSGRVKTSTTGGDGGGGVMAIPSGSFARTRMGYDPDTMVDYTSTNPAYWNSVVSYFKGKPNGNPATGELGIWIPNFEKQGAESPALAAIAGGVTAHVNSNYSNNTVTDTGRATASLTGPGSESYRGGAEKAIRLNSISRGGTDVETGRPMGGTDPIGYGAHIKGGKVVKGAMSGYLKDGGDYGGLLGKGTSITGGLLTRLLGGMDKDGMRLRGTMPSVMGATGSGVGAGGTATGMGTFYGGGTDPLAKMPGVADYTPYIDPNSVFGGRSSNAAVRSGLLYQPMASDYGAKMAAAGMPSFSPTSGLISSPGGMGGVRIGGVGAPTYGASPSGFSPAAIAALGGGTATVGSSAGLRGGMTAGSHSTHLGAYQLADGSWVWGDMPSEGGHDPTGGAIAHGVSPESTMMSHGMVPGEFAHPGSVFSAMMGPMASTAGTTVAPGVYGHAELEGLLGSMEGASAAAAEAEAEAAAEAVGMGGIGAL